MGRPAKDITERVFARLTVLESESPYASYERVLEALGLPRTRENYLFVMYDGVLPEEWDDEAEEQLPPDLRIT